MARKFFLQASQIKDVLPLPCGGCIATDMITVSGKKVGRMWRDQPHNHQDSGWVFIAGTEDQAYLDDANNMTVYDVNTIANYDPEIIPLLYSAPGSEYERDKAGKFVPVGKSKPLFGCVNETAKFGDGWSLWLPTIFCSRVEGSNLVLWRTGITLWISRFNDKKKSSAEALFADAQKQVSPGAKEVAIVRDGPMIRYSYIVIERDPNRQTPEYPCLMSHTFIQGQWNLIAMHCDTPEAIAIARGIHASIQHD